MKNGKKPETERKSVESVAGRNDSRMKFGALLKWHLERGTRPGSDPALHGLPWNRKRFSDAIQLHGSAETLQESIDRTVRNWCSGSSLPHDLTAIETVLFGPEPANATADSLQPFRQDLRAAFRAARPAAELATAQQQSPMKDAAVPIPGKSFGRAMEEARAVETILAGPPGGSVLILGNAGHGKTMLAQQTAIHPEIIRHFGQRRFFVGLEQADSAALALRELAAAFDIEPSAPIAAVLSRLEKIGAPLLLVLDNLETPLQAPGQRQATEQLLQQLTRVSGLSLIATLRSHETVGAIGWTQIFFLENLPPEDARVMFLSIAQTISDDDADLGYFTGINGVLGGVPLAIRLAAHRVFTQKTLQMTRRDWEKHGALLASSPAADDARADSLLASISFSLHSSKLRAEGLVLFSLLGQLPAGLDLEDCDSLLGEASSDAIAQLRLVGLLRDIDGNRIGLLPPVRDIAQRRYPPDHTATDRWVAYFLELLTESGKKVGNADGRSAVERLAREMANITAALSAAIAQARQMDVVAGALQGLERGLRYTGYRADATLDQLEMAFRRSGDLISIARCLVARASAARMRSENVLAIRQIEEAVILLRDAPYPELLGLCFFFLGDMARMEDRHGEARGHYEQSRSHYQAAGYASGEGNCLFGMAEIFRIREEHRSARQAYEEALVFCKRSGSVNCEAECLVGIADMARTRDDPVCAKENFTEALALFRKSGWRAGEADCLWGLGCVALMQAENALSCQRFEEALSLHTDNGTIVGSGNCYWGLAEVARAQSRSEAATEFYTKAIEQFEAAAWPGGVAMGELGLAKILANENASAAEPLFHSALLAFRQAGMLLDEADCLMGLAALHGGSEARRLCAEAKRLYFRAESPGAIKRCDAMLEALSATHPEAAEPYQTVRWVSEA